MTTLTATITLNDRSNDVCCIRGVRLEVVDLPALTGTPKQVAWADKIRTSALEAIRDGIEIALDRGIPNHMCTEAEFARVSQRTQGAADRLAAGLGTYTAASWWIDNRDKLSRNAASALLSEQHS